MASIMTVEIDDNGALLKVEGLDRNGVKVVYKPDVMPPREYLLLDRHSIEVYEAKDLNGEAEEGEPTHVAGHCITLNGKTYCG